MLLQRGAINDEPGRRGWQPSSTFTIGSNRAHHAATIPFSDTFLLPSAKPEQYQRWRNAPLAHEALHPSKIGRGPSPCSQPGGGLRCADAGSAGPTTTVPPVTELAAHVAGFIVARATSARTAQRRGSGSPSGWRQQTGARATSCSSCSRRHHHGDAPPSGPPRRELAGAGAPRALVHVVVPFMDHHLPPSHKREQYVTWRALLLEYWDYGARRVRPCTHHGCEAPRRCKGLCRHHYYLGFGR